MESRDKEVWVFLLVIVFLRIWSRRSEVKIERRGDQKPEQEYTRQFEARSGEGDDRLQRRRRRQWGRVLSEGK